jgi:glycosyltransferase involved in cell wall biosynthesis
MVKISIVVALYNEEENISPLIANIDKAFQSGNIEYEAILVNDGSTDNTAGEIRSQVSEKVTFVDLKRNYGQTAALKAGVDQADGDYIATLDGDLQNDPDDLPMMLNLLIEKDCDLVTGIRAIRADRFILRKSPSYIANWIIRKITRTNIRDNGSGIKLFKADILKELPLYGERHRLLPTIAMLEGASVEQVNVRHHPRIYGKSKYGIGRTLKVISDLILMQFSRKYRQKPMYLFGSVGFVISLAGFVILIYLFIEKLMGYDIWGRPIMLLGILFILFGFQIISTGLLIDAVVRNNYETGKEKPYKIKSVVKAE